MEISLFNLRKVIISCSYHLLFIMRSYFQTANSFSQSITLFRSLLSLNIFRRFIPRIITWRTIHDRDEALLLIIYHYFIQTASMCRSLHICLFLRMCRSLHIFLSLRMCLPLRMCRFPHMLQSPHI